MEPTQLNPQDIKVIEPKATYEIPTFRVDNDGLHYAGPTVLRFCKGNKADDTIFRQEGLFTETLIAAAVQYLQENNVGDLASRETSMAITHLQEALHWIEHRAKDRARRGVQGTYQK